MKKIILPVVLAIAMTGAVSAQGYGFGPGRGTMSAPAVQAQLPAPVIESIEGKLELVNAAPAIKVGTVTYLVRIPGGLWGFIDGLKEGAHVKLEGYKFPIPAQKDTFVFHVEKLTLAGRTIDLSAAVGGPGMAGGKMHQGSGMGGMGAMGGAGPGMATRRGGFGRY